MLSASNSDATTLAPCSRFDALHVSGGHDGGKRWSDYTFVYNASLAGVRARFRMLKVAR
jgi:hypothetical protein